MQRVPEGSLFGGIYLRSSECQPMGFYSRDESKTLSDTAENSAVGYYSLELELALEHESGEIVLRLGLRYVREFAKCG